MGQHKLNTLSLAILALMSAGCTTFHPMVNEVNVQSVFDNYRNNYGLGVAENVNDALENIEKYQIFYAHKSDELLSEIYSFGDASLIAAFAGLLSGTAGFAEGAVGGAFLSSAALIPNERYGLAVQATNYRKASETMQCVYVKSVSFRTQYTDEVLPNIDHYNMTIFKIRNKLRELQRSVEITTPDLQGMLDAAKSAAKSEEAAVDDKQQAEDAQMLLEQIKESEAGIQQLEHEVRSLELNNANLVSQTNELKNSIQQQIDAYLSRIDDNELLIRNGEIEIANTKRIQSDLSAPQGFKEQLESNQLDEKVQILRDEIHDYQETNSIQRDLIQSTLNTKKDQMNSINQQFEFNNDHLEEYRSLILGERQTLLQKRLIFQNLTVNLREIKKELADKIDQCVSAL